MDRINKLSVSVGIPISSERNGFLAEKQFLLYQWHLYRHHEFLLAPALTPVQGYRLQQVDDLT